MSGMILKHRARKPVARGEISDAGIYPAGVGGIDGHQMVYQFSIGDLRVFLTADSWKELTTQFTALERGQ